LRISARPGFGVLELLISTAIFLIALLLTVGLLAESQTTMVQVNRAARDPLPDFALTLLRRDVVSSRRVVPSPTPGALVLELAAAGGGSVTYLKNGDRLERFTADGAQRLLMTGVESFDWWKAGSRLLEIQISFERQRPLAARGLLSSVRALRGESRLQTVRVRVALRAAGARRW